ncbi:MAG: 50S ribosomal protein L24 [Candidatus Omnitrophota bacterium]
MFKIRKGDTVQVTKGRDSGKKGKVLSVLPAAARAVVEGINLVKKHKRQTRQDEKGGIVSIETPISVANLMLVCKNCGRGVHVGFKILQDKTKSRLCKSCNEVI